MTEHIDGSRLSDDLRYRFEYLSRFINFTHDDVTALNKLATIILPRVPVIVDAVYRKLFQFDITKHYFVLRNDGFDGELKDNEAFTLDSTQMTYRRDVLSGYLKRLLLQREWSDDFLQYLSRVGRMHTNKMGSVLTHVDYMHINATLCYLETLFTDAVWTIVNLDNNSKRDILNALNKAFRIQSDFFFLHFLEPSKETNTSTSSNPHKIDKCISS